MKPLNAVTNVSLLNEKDITAINHSFLVLINTKVAYTRVLAPVSACLCNVSFKILTEVLVNRLKRLMSSLISNNQSSFVPGRHVVGNIIVYQEVVRSMSQRKGRKGLMAIKVDLDQ